MGKANERMQNEGYGMSYHKLDAVTGHDVPLTSRSVSVLQQVQRLLHRAFTRRLDLLVFESHLNLEH